MIPTLLVAAASAFLAPVAAMCPTVTTIAVTPPTSGQCCSSTVSSTSSGGSAILAALCIALTGAGSGVAMGLDCVPDDDPVTCGAVSVICDTPDPSWDGLFAINCLPPPPF
ncbi:hypothetical protein GGX14DRAFT_403098 [Mycena pura]|uniref:Hydrophobin n=1 Tax=Mycena pura TaxID=153505 RepID=A0AAD6UWX8_9AGAR|nr:hypothetical protein GGX14DRAFT_403098 [Mycena pura]